MASRSLFSKLGPALEQEVLKPTVSEDTTLRNMIQAYRGFKVSLPGEVLEVLDEPYEEALKLVRGMKYSSKDVTSFCIALAGIVELEERHTKKAGLFLSALVNSGSDQEYVLSTRGLPYPIDDFGFHNVKDVVIEGDVGMCCGFGMKDGTIKIHGNADQCIGNFMIGGYIELSGNTTNFGWMKGGTIRVFGNADDSIRGGQGGTIFLEGDYGRLATHLNQEQKIFHKGVQIWPKEGSS